MKYKIAADPEIIEKIRENERFRRLTGVRKETFDKMAEILTAAHIQKKCKGGRPNKLSVETMLLMALEYWREYRTYFYLMRDPYADMLQCLICPEMIVSILS